MVLIRVPAFAGLRDETLFQDAAEAMTFEDDSWYVG